MARTTAQHSDDELDRQIDAALDRAGGFVGFWLRVALALALPAAAIWAGTRSAYAATLVPTLLWVGIVALQIAFAVLLGGLVLAGAAWLVSRPLVRWTLPSDRTRGLTAQLGEAEASEAERRIVSTIRGLKLLKGLHGEGHRGLLLVGRWQEDALVLTGAIAAETGVPLGYVNVPSLRRSRLRIPHLHLGRIYARARSLARSHGACIIFLDDVDRALAVEGKAATRQSGDLLSEILVQMSPANWPESAPLRLLRAMGLRWGPPVWPPVITVAHVASEDVLGATPAWTGCFDWRIRLDPPTEETRAQIIGSLLQHVPHDSTITAEEVAERTDGRTTDSIGAVVVDGLALARADDRSELAAQDLAEALLLRSWPGSTTVNPAPSVLGVELSRSEATGSAEVTP